MTNYYVNAEVGVDKGPGTTRSTAWQTLKRLHAGFIAGEFHGGDAIWFHRGHTFPASHMARLWMRNVAGLTADTPLHLGAYGEGEARPCISGFYDPGFGSVVFGNAEPINHIIAEDLHIVSGGTGCPGIYLDQAKRWALRRLTFGGHPVDRIGGNLTVRYSSNVLLEDCEATGTPGSPIYLGKAAKTEPNVTDVVIRRCHVTGERAECIDLKGDTRQVIVENCFLDTAHGDGCVSLRGDGHTIRQNEIRNATGPRGIASYPAPDPTLSFLIEENLIIGATEHGVKLYGMGHTVRRNTILGCPTAVYTRHRENSIYDNIYADCEAGLEAAWEEVPDIDHNCYWHVGIQLRLHGSGGDQTIAEACTEHGIECNSIIADPGFLNDRYEIREDSPCCRAGRDGRSMGYHEPKIEIPSARTAHAKVFENGDGTRTIITTLSPLHYESVPDSGVFDTEIDCKPIRVNNSQLNGWRITTNGWHYTLGQPAGEQNGWVGFGGRQGEHWFRFRLARVGYLHWPTRTFDPISGAPDYNRSNLSHQINDLNLLPDRSLAAESVITWNNLFTTPGGGELSARWRISGDGLKEEIVINQAGRERIAANHPPITPMAETWFGFVFEIDLSDIPRIVRDGIVLDPNDDFADDGCSIELRDTMDRILAFLPLDHAYVLTGDPGGEQETHKVALRKRFWRDGETCYLLVGARVDELNALPDGDLVFDPTVNPQVGASADDATITAGPNFSYTNTAGYFGAAASHSYDCGWRFTLNVPAAAIISNAYVRFTAINALSGATVRTEISYQDANDPADFSGDDHAAFNARVRSATVVAWDGVGAWSAESTYDSPDISTIIQALINEAYWASGEHCVIFVDDDSSDASAYRKAYSYDGAAAKAPVLYVTYTTSIAVKRRRREGY